MQYAVNLNNPAGSMHVEVEAPDCHTAVFRAYPAILEALTADLKRGLMTETQHKMRVADVSANNVTVTVREVR